MIPLHIHFDQDRANSRGGGGGGYIEGVVETV